MTQEDFEKKSNICEAIKLMEITLSKVDCSQMRMVLDGFAESYFGYRDMVSAAYTAYIPKEERDRLTAQMREQLKTAIQARIDELKTEFEKL